MTGINARVARSATLTATETRCGFVLAEDAHGSVRRSDGTTCLAGRCLSRAVCDPGAQGVCGEAGRCSLLSWGLDQGMCGLQEPNPGSAGRLATRARRCRRVHLPDLAPGRAAVDLSALCRPLEGGGAAHATLAAPVCPNYRAGKGQRLGLRVPRRQLKAGRVARFVAVQAFDRLA